MQTIVDARQSVLNLKSAKIDDGATARLPRINHFTPLESLHFVSIFSVVNRQACEALGPNIYTKFEHRQMFVRFTALDFSFVSFAHRALYRLFYGLV